MITRTPVLLASALLAIPMVAQSNQYDSRIDSYVGLRYACDGGVQPVLRIQNVGGETMTSCDIDILKNGLTETTFDWQLTVPAATNEFRQPALPVINGIQPGDELEFRILTVNGQPDEGIDGNILVVPMTDEKGDASSYQVQVKVFTDDQPEETSWRIRNAAGAVVAQSPVYDEAGVERTTPVTLSADECYNFELADSGGNGFGEARELGYAKLLSLGEEVVSVSGDFAALYRKGVQTGTENGCVPTGLSSVPEPTVSCGNQNVLFNSTTLYADEVPGANLYRFTFTNITGQPVYGRNITSPTRALPISRWATLPLKLGRTYDVRVRGSLDNGATWCDFGPTCQIRVGYGSVGVSGARAMQVDEELEGALYTLFPNPSEDGSFNIITEAIDEEEVILIEAFDLMGKSVARTTVQPMEQGQVTPVPLGVRLPTGLYMVQITVGGTVRTEKLLVR